MAKALDLHPVNPGSVPAVHPYESLVASGRASGRNYSRAPEKRHFTGGHVRGEPRTIDVKKNVFTFFIQGTFFTFLTFYIFQTFFIFKNVH